MDKTRSKAREIEALTFQFKPDTPSAAPGSDTRLARRFRLRPAAVGLTAVFVVIAGLAWAMFSS